MATRASKSDSQTERVPNFEALCGYGPRRLTRESVDRHAATDGELEAAVAKREPALVAAVNDLRAIHRTAQDCYLSATREQRAAAKAMLFDAAYKLAVPLQILEEKKAVVFLERYSLTHQADLAKEKAAQTEVETRPEPETAHPAQPEAKETAMAMDDDGYDYSYRPDEDDLREFSDREAWEDAQADARDDAMARHQEELAVATVDAERSADTLATIAINYGPGFTFEKLRDHFEDVGDERSVAAMDAAIERLYRPEPSLEQQPTTAGPER